MHGAFVSRKTNVKEGLYIWDYADIHVCPCGQGTYEDWRREASNSFETIEERHIMHCPECKQRYKWSNANGSPRSRPDREWPIGWIPLQE